MSTPCKHCQGTGQRFNASQKAVTICGYCKGTGNSTAHPVPKCLCGMVLHTRNALNHRQSCPAWQAQFTTADGPSVTPL